MKFINSSLNLLIIGLLIVSCVEKSIISEEYQMGRFEASYRSSNILKSRVKAKPVKQGRAKPVSLFKDNNQALSVPCRQNNVIFDVGGVLLEVSKFKAFTKLGMSCIFHTDIGDRFMEFVTFIEPETIAFTKENQPKYLNKNLPPLMCRWQKGEFSCQEFVDKIKDAIDKNPNFFKNKSEQSLMKKSANLLLPENHIGIEKIKSSGLKLLKQLKDKKDKNGNPVNNLFIISNFDYETFALLQKKFPELFGHFNEEQIIVSGRVKMIKPHKNIFEHTLNKFQLSPKSCIFIDDQLENVEGAISCGMSAIHHTDSKVTHNRLKALGII